MNDSVSEVKNVSKKSSDYEKFMALVKASSLNNIKGVNLYFLKLITDGAFVLKNEENEVVKAGVAFSSGIRSIIMLSFSSFKNCSNLNRFKAHRSLGKTHKYVSYEAGDGLDESTKNENIIKLLNGIKEKIYFILDNKELEGSLDKDRYEAVVMANGKPLQSADGSGRTYYKTREQLEEVED